MAVANRERGEVAIEVNGKPYVLKLSMNAAVQLEGKTGKKIGGLLAEAVSLDFAAIRDIVWLLLQKHHADEFTTAEQAGNFIDDAGGVDRFFAALEELGKANAPDTTATGTLGNPPGGQANTTGARSIATPGA